MEIILVNGGELDKIQEDTFKASSMVGMLSWRNICAEWLARPSSFIYNHKLNYNLSQLFSFT